jgi:hypothetical protein
MKSTEEFPHFPPSNPLSACNHTKALTIVIRYTPVAGFVGTDFLTFQVEDREREDEKKKAYKAAITVR